MRLGVRTGLLGVMASLANITENGHAVGIPAGDAINLGQTWRTRIRSGRKETAPDSQGAIALQRQTSVETRGNFAVIGLGINCRRDPALEARLKRPLAALDQYVAVDRNQLIERVAQSLLEALAMFQAHGLEPLRGEWERLDAHAGKRLRVRLADGRTLTGVSRGLDAQGGLKLETRAGLRAILSGRVLSARPA